MSAASGVLRSTASYEFGVVVLEEVFVEGHVFFFGEDGVVGFDAILFEESFISIDEYLAERPPWICTAQVRVAMDGLLPFSLNI